MKINKHTICETKEIYEALVALSRFVNNEPLVLFVMNDNDQIVGTLTDGDIRRSLVNGATVQSPISQVAHRDFKFLKENEADIELVHRCRELGVELLPVVDCGMHIINIVNLRVQKSVLPLDAVLMAGGKGMRLRPLTETIPKPLLPVGGKPIIDYNIDTLMENGVKHISVTVNYLHEQLEEHFAEPMNGVKIDCIKEPQFLGTMGATQFVSKFYNDVVLVMNSDLFTNIDFEDFYLHFKECDADMSVAAVPYSVSVPYGIFELEGRNIKGVKEKPVYNYFANAGIYLIKRELLEAMPKNIFYNATDLMNDAVAAGKTVIRYPITGYWLDIGSHEEYNKANELVKHIKK